MIGVFCAVLLVGQLGFSQQPQGQRQTISSAPAPPAQASPSPAPSPKTAQEHRETNAQIESDLNSVFSGDPALSGANVQAAVDDVKIELTGTLETQAQVERVMALVSPYANERKVVNKMSLH